jgi:hypothetical protein
MSESAVYSHPKIPEVLSAFELLLNDSMALDYCGVTGKDRKIILNDPAFSREAKRIKAGKYIEEIQDINNLVRSLGRTGSDENARFSDGDEDPTKVITLKMKVASMRREMLSLSSNDKETDEAESLNIFFIDVTREEFERMQNVEVHEGATHAQLISELDKDAPSEVLNKKRKDEKAKTSIPAELSRNTIEYVNEHGDRVIEEVYE